MKKRNKTKAFEKFTKRNTHKRRSKLEAQRALLRAVEETNVGYSSLRITDTVDRGRAGRVSSKHRRDEIVAEGIFSSSRSGYGFVALEGRDDDIFIPEGRCLGAIDGDYVEIIYHEYRSHTGEYKTEGRIRKILKMSRLTVIGKIEEERVYYRSKGRPYIIYILKPDSEKIGEAFRIRSLGNASVGDKVEAKIIRSTDASQHECEIIRNFGRADSREANYEAILSDCEIETEFSEEALREAEELARLPLSEEGRVRRGEVIFTIDGEGAKDLDDAISLRKVRGGYRLGVHIADVSYYVREKTHLDRTAMARGTSVYFADKVVPMLPKVLSNGACSLNAGEDKYTLSAIISLDDSGEIKGVKIEPSIIRSRVRGVYSEVNKIFDNTADAHTRVKYKEVMPSLRRMHELYLILKKKSVARGSIGLETSEAEILLSDGVPTDIIRRTRGDAECMIEEFMLCANEAVARFLSLENIPCVYRVHEDPPPDRLAEFLRYAHNLGFNTSVISIDKSEPKDFSYLLSKAEQRGVLAQVSYAMLRSMSKAKYSDIRSRHFGLSLSHYCHFTSPIRRLSDLATHRIIHKVLLENKRKEAYIRYARRVATVATEAEIRAVSAERRIENLYKAIYMKDRVGEEFVATINSITSFGFFAELDNTCEGLVPISSLSGMFIFDEGNVTLRSSSITYHIADKVVVRLEEADIERGKLRFSVVD